MKKSFYWLAMLMLGLSCALWTGCSDDDDDKTPGPGDGDDPIEVVTDTVYQVKSVRIVDVEQGDAFYKLVEMKRTGKELTGLTIANYTDRGINGAEQNVVLEKKGNKIRLAQDLGGYYQKIEYSFNNQGFVTSALMYNSDEEEAWSDNDPDSWGDEVTYTFSYDPVTGMLNKIVVPMEDDESDEGDMIDVTMFTATFQADSNLATVLMDPASQMTGSCASSEVLNNYTLDLNLLSCMYSENGVINYAVWCGWVPNTPNLIKSITVTGGDEEDDEDGEAQSLGTKAGEHVIAVTPGYDGDKVSTLDLKVGDSTSWKKFVLGY